MPIDRFTNWPEEYARKSMAPEEAAKLVKSGDTIAIPIGSICPALSKAIYARGNELTDVEIVSTAPFVDPGWFEPGHPAFKMEVEIFNSAAGRKPVNEGRAGFISVPFSRRWKGLRERGRSRHDADVAIIGVSPPDRFGFCSFGLSMWNKATFAREARTVLAEVFDGFPRTGGANQIHVSEIDAFVPGEVAPPRALREPAEFHPAYIHHVGELVRNGDTIQLGTGAITAQFIPQGGLWDKEDLGFHSEISVPGMNDLVMQGIATGAKKNLHKGKFVATALTASTPEELDFIHENPVYEVYDVEYTNDIATISANDNLVAINNAIAVDLYGQVASESVGHDLWSGPGGQLEFAIGAMLSKGGRGITLLPSTAKGGTVSRITVAHEPGTIVTVPRQFVDYVITEWGIARLYGKSDRERAEELIAIAHPDHRAELRKQAQKL